MIRYTEDPHEVSRLLLSIGGSDATLDDLLDAVGGWHAWVWGGGVFVVHMTEDPGEYEVHTYVYPTGRGIHAVRAARAAIDVELGMGRRLIGRTPIDNRPARMFAALCGGRRIGVEGGEEVRRWGS